MTNTWCQLQRTGLSPRIKPGTNEDTIGYRIQSKSIREEKGRKYFRTNFRLSFVGEHAEELSQEVLLWQCGL